MITRAQIKTWIKVAKNNKMNKNLENFNIWITRAVNKATLSNKKNKTPDKNTHDKKLNKIQNKTKHKSTLTLSYEETR